MASHSSPDSEQAAAEQPLERLIDTHAHILSGDRSLYPPARLDATAADTLLKDPFDIAKLSEGMEAAGVSHACLVQRALVYGHDNRYVLDAAASDRSRFAPVTVLRADDPASPMQLRALAAEHSLGGLRFSPTNAAASDTGWLDAPAAIETWRTAADLGIPVALFCPVRQLGHVLPALRGIAEMFPGVPIILDHLGIAHRTDLTVAKDRADGFPDPFLGPPDYAIAPALKAMRAHRNVVFKLTSINLDRLGSDGIDTALFMRRLVDEFGADRLMWGSDSAQSQGPYTRLVSSCRTATQLLSRAERDDLSYKTAARLYGFEHGIHFTPGGRPSRFQDGRADQTAARRTGRCRAGRQRERAAAR
jgi:predicted TIM-barrel fold metal-dependent hydrolase